MADLGRFAIHTSRKRLIERAASVRGAPIEMASVKDMDAEAMGLSVPVRVYTPKGDGPFPVVVFYHGGGWVQGNRDTHDWPCRAIADRSGAVVVSVDYRLAPEHPYPAAVNDAYAALVWVKANGKSLNTDPLKIAVAGDSAGGNLAAAVCLMSRDRKGPSIAFQALIYPGLDAANLDTDSYRFFGTGYMLNKANIERSPRAYLPTGATARTPTRRRSLPKATRTCLRRRHHGGVTSFATSRHAKS